MEDYLTAEDEQDILNLLVTCPCFFCGGEGGTIAYVTGREVIDAFDLPVSEDALYYIPSCYRCARNMNEERYTPNLYRLVKAHLDSKE